MSKTTSDRGIQKIKVREGEILKGYLDSKGLLTVGVGHLVKPGEPYKKGVAITQAESTRLLKQDLAEAEHCVNSNVKVPLTQNQFDALVSFVVNIGTGGFKKSSTLRLLNQKEYTAAGNALMKWVKPPEITGRRKTEKVQFFTPDPISAAASNGTSAKFEQPTAISPSQEQPVLPPTPPQEANQTIVSVPPVQTEPPDPGVIGKLQTWYAAAPAFLLSALGGLWSWIQGAAVEIIVAFLVAAGIVAIVFIILNYRGRQNEKQRLFEAEQAQKNRDFELTKIQLQSAADPNKQTVRLQPPPNLIPNGDAPVEEKV